MSTVKEVIEKLQKNYNESDVVAVDIWVVEDVLERAKDLDMSVTHQQAEYIINDMDNSVDAEFGLTWSDIDFHLHYMQKDEENELDRKAD